MENNKEIKPFLEYTDEEGKQFFHEGDRIICRTVDGKRYMGRIVKMCGYRESEEVDLEHVIFLNTSQNEMSYSGEIIKIRDIAFMRKVPMGDMFGYPITNEDLDKSNFINVMIGLGYVKEEAEMLYGRMKELISLCNIPLSIMLVDVVQGADLSIDGRSEEEFVDISKKLLNVVAGFLQSTTDKIKEARILGTDSLESKVE